MNSPRRKPDEIDQFKKWLVERGAELLIPTNPYEIVRFRAAGRAGIVYEKQNGARTMTGEALGAWADFKSRDGSWKPERRVKRKGKTAVIVKTLIARDGNVCFYCGDPFTEDRPPTREHLISVIHDGPNHISNSFLSCQKCNTEAGHLSAPEKIRMRDRKRRGRGATLLGRAFDRLFGGEGDLGLQQDIQNFFHETETKELAANE